jgi:hypothetical protein
MATAVAISAIASAANVAQRDDLDKRGEGSGALGPALTSGSVSCECGI